MRFNEINQPIERDALGRPVFKDKEVKPPAAQQQQAVKTNPLKKFQAPLANYTVSRGIKPGHAGVDLVVAPGSALLAPEDGVVLDEGAWLRAGEMIKLQTVTGIHKFMHLAPNSILVQKGQRVRQGDRIAQTGNTGRTTGPHLHWELWVNNQPVNPLDYL